MTILTGINLLNYLDRWSVAGILPELQAEFGVSDAQGGLLTSVFVVSYMLLSPLFGFLGDRLPRKNILILGVSVWCASSLAGSWVNRFDDLLICRALVGVGEASYATIAPTLIADLYAAEERARWLSVYFVAVPVGSALGFIVGGTTAAYMGWRWAFRFTPCSAIVLISLLYFFMEEPVRGQADRHGGIDAVFSSDGETRLYEAGCTDFLKDTRDIWKTKSFFWSTLGLTSITFVLGALAQWGPSLLTRINCLEEKHLTECKYHINLVFGVISCVTGILGTLLGAWLSTRFSRPDNAADAVLCSIGLALAAPCISLALRVAPRSLNLAWMFIFLGEVAVSITWAPVTAMLLYVIVPRQRGLASGMQTLTSHLFGDASSPVLVGYIADYLREHHDLDRAEGLQKALYPTAAWALVGSLFFAVATIFISHDRAAMSARVAESARYGVVPTRDADMSDGRGEKAQDMEVEVSPEVETAVLSSDARSGLISRGPAG